MSDAHLYRIQFVNQGKIYEIYAREIGHGGIFGFLEIAGFEFGKRTEIVVDPAEEKLKDEFDGVKRSFIPMHSVIRIDEVEKRGNSKISDAEGNVTPFPMSYFGPGTGPGGKK